jgi:hypothetical protein
MLQVNQPMGLGDLLDGAFRVYRAHFAHLVLIAAIFLVPVGVATTLLLGYTVDGFGALFFASAGEADLAPSLPNAVAVFAYLGLGVLGYLAMAMAYASLTSYIVAILQGEDLSIGASIRRGLRRLLPFVGMALLAGLAIGGIALGLYLVLAFLFFVIAAAVGVLGSLGDEMGPLAIGLMIAAFFFYLVAIFLVLIPLGLLAARWIVASTVVVAEKLGPQRSLNRSWALTRNNLWRCFGFLALLVIFNFVVIGLPISILQWVLMFALAPQWYGWLSGLVAGLSYFVNILWYPILVLALTLLYFDLRVRNESLDLDMRIRRLEQSTVTASQPQPQPQPQSPPQSPPQVL